MSLIKFPSSVEPSKVTIDLTRADELFISPVTAIQTGASRKGSYWKWTYEFRNISESEREIVEAFLAKCRGALNNFKVTDSAEYSIRGSMSDWIDIFSGYGSFSNISGSGTSDVNSEFSHSSNVVHHVTEEQTVRFEWRKLTSTSNLGWRKEGASYKVSSLAVGKSYVQRIKHFQMLDRVAHSFSFRVGSGNSAYSIQSAPSTPVTSSDCVTAPFYVGRNVSSTAVSIVDWINLGRIGDSWKYADYRLQRCALVANSENLLLRSNEFDTNWSITDASVASGYGDTSPLGVNSGSWKLFVNSAASPTLHHINQTITKINTEDFYSFSIYGRANEYSEIRLQLDFGGGTDASWATYWLNSGTVSGVSEQGVHERTVSEIFDVGSGYYRCVLKALVSSAASLRALCYISSGAGVSFTGNGSDGIEIFGAQLRKFPFAGPYVPTTSLAVVGSGYQTGDTLVVDGFDPGDIIKGNSRIEIVNRFNNAGTGVYERSEFKKITEETVVHREGWVVLPIDPPIRNAPVPDRSYRQQTHLGETMHNPVIFHNAEMKGRLLGGTVQTIEKPLQLTDIVFDVIEDLSE